MSKIPNLTINMMVKNEEKYIRQSLLSVAPYVERTIVVDTGSTDKTIQYIEELQKKFPSIELYRDKVDGDSINWNGNHMSQHLTDIRNNMLGMSKTKWVWQVDGDEIYPIKSIMTLKKAVENLEQTDKDWVRGLMVKIRWCVSEEEYIEPGPFSKTLRIFPSRGRFVGQFPDEFLYVDARPITITDHRTLTVDGYFLHMSMALHPKRRPPNGTITKLSNEELFILETK